MRRWRGRRARPRVREETGPDAAELAYRRLVGRRVRQRRRALKLNQQQLADAVGVSRNYISDLEQGQHAVNAWRVVRLSAVLQAPATWLLDPSTGPRSTPAPR